MKKAPQLILRRMLAGPRQLFQRGRRKKIACRWLTGDGIEIGALHNPLSVPAECKVTYVDRMDVEDLRRQYTELSKSSLIPVDIVDDGEFLIKISNESQNFVIANHFLEHCENPIAALEAWLRVLKLGGIAFVTVPDKRFTFDFARPTTKWQHVLREYHEGCSWSRQEHYREWAELVDGVPAQELFSRVQTLMNLRYSIHFHVWTSQSLSNFFNRCEMETGLPFTICKFIPNGTETIVVLKKIEIPASNVNLR
jgi:predicted SAM-dependent methyltransferase